MHCPRELVHPLLLSKTGLSPTNVTNSGAKGTRRGVSVRWNVRAIVFLIYLCGIAGRNPRILSEPGIQLQILSYVFCFKGLVKDVNIKGFRSVSASIPPRMVQRALTSPEMKFLEGFC